MSSPYLNTCVAGDCRDTMLAMIAAGVRVQTVITSPPYWGLRDYGVAGQLGLEATPAEYLANMVHVFQLVRELLVDDGTLWLNMGDSYAGSRCGGETGASTLRGSRETQEQAKLARASFRRDRTVTPRSDLVVDGLKPKDLVGMPWRLAFALQADGWFLRSDIIWHKPNPMPESVSDRPTKAHEYVFLLTKSERYFYDAEAIKEPCSPDTHARYARGRSNMHKYVDGGPGDQTIARSFAHMAKPVAGWANGDGDHSAAGHAQPSTDRDGRKLLRKVYRGNGVGFGHGFDDEHKPRVKNNASFDAAMAVMPETRNKRTVWTIPTQSFKGAHFATFPEALVEPCVLAGSRVGDTVFDPFLGSGTVAQVAQNFSRNWIGCDLNQEYIRMQAERTAQHGFAL